MNPGHLLVFGLSSVVTILASDGQLERIVRKLKRVLKVCRSKRKRNLLPDSEEEASIGAFICPLSKAIMANPVMTPHGYCFERASIEEYIEEHQKCPLTGFQLEKSSLKTCFTLRFAIEEFKKGEEQIIK